MRIAPPLGRRQCADLLTPHLPTLARCFSDAWAKWEKWLGALEAPPTTMTPRSRANVLYDLLVHEVEVAFSETPGVATSRKRGFLVVRVDERVALRIKKFRGRTLKTSGNNTQQTLRFDEHQLEVSDETLQPVTHLVAGYLLDDLALGVKKLAVTCMVDGRHFWAPIEVTGSDDRQTAPVYEARADDPTATKPGVRGKRTRPTQETSEGE